MSKDYYKILGVDKSASADEIKRAYKKLAVKHHPDVNKEAGAEAKFKEINEAYQVLSDPQKKANYDQFGSADMGNMGGQGFGGFSGGQGGFDFSNFSGEGFGGFDDVFDIFFGGGGKRTKAQNRGSDVEIIMPLDFKEAVFGTEKDISYSVMDICPQCHGKGGSGLKKCSDCGGSGKVNRVTRTILGAFNQVQTCPVCKGRGEVPSEKCHKCGGASRIRQTKNIKVKIPAGVNNDSSIRIPGAGEGGQDGNGDLYLRIKINPHKEFIRDGYDIYSEKEISFSSATLGDKVEINTVDGPLKLVIPAGTQSHTEFRLKGKGVPHPNQRGVRGDHYVTIKVRIPRKLSREERDMLEKLKGL